MKVDKFSCLTLAGVGLQAVVKVPSEAANSHADIKKVNPVVSKKEKLNLRSITY